MKESKHKSLRKVTTISTAIAFNLIIIQGLKYGIEEPRPDGSANNSFPSGHTATAFMGAHIFPAVFETMLPLLRQFCPRAEIIVVGLAPMRMVLHANWMQELATNLLVAVHGKILMMDGMVTLDLLIILQLHMKTVGHLETAT